MSLKVRHLQRFLSVMAGIVLVNMASAQQPRNLTPEQTDSLNKSVAVVISASLDPIIQNLQSTGIPLDKAEVGRYIADILSGKNFGITPTEANAYVESTIRRNTSLPIESQNEFVRKAAAEPGAITTPSGLVFQVLVEGEGAHPTIDDQVYVRYVGRFSDGSVFDDTENETVTFDLQNEIPGFVEGLKMMKPGGTYRLVVPSGLAYGEEGIPGIIPGNAALDFTVTLDSVKPSAK